MMNILLEAAPKGGFFSNPLNMILISAAMFVLYFFMLRPNKKKADEAKKLMEEMVKGDKIITLGGIHGKVFKINEDTIEIEIAKNTVMTIDKNSISSEATAALNKPVEEKK
jgi:preprotein translocase subunit YajC